MGTGVSKDGTIGDGIRMGAKIGSGGFSEVYSGTLKTGTPCAVKVISKKVFKSKEDHDDMLREVEIMKRVAGHPNVVNTYASFEDKERFVIVLELASGGDVMSRIEKMLERGEHFSEKVASRYFLQMLQAVKHCHDRLVVHRDLKPENFLLDTADGTGVKLTDFGLSALLARPDETLTEGCGSAYYIAPEIFAKRYGPAVDVFALGVILFIMLSGTVPFGGSAADEKGIFRAIQTDPLVFGKGWDSITPAARELITGMLEKDPTKRYTVEQALAHPWVTGDAASDKAIDRAVLNALLAFNARNKFKKAAIEMVASHLTAKDVQAMRETFMKIDTDNSGLITTAELMEALKGMKALDKAEAKSLVDSIDVDKDGKISWEEFLHATLEAQMVKHQQQIWTAFNELDTDGSGSITVDELRVVLKDEPPEVIEKYIAEYDTDKDGTINYEEFLRMLLPKTLKFRVTKTTTE